MLLLLLLFSGAQGNPRPWPRPAQGETIVHIPSRLRSPRNPIGMQQSAIPPQIILPSRHPLLPPQSARKVSETSTLSGGTSRLGSLSPRSPRWSVFSPSSPMPLLGEGRDGGGRERGEREGRGEGRWPKEGRGEDPGMVQLLVTPCYFLQSLVVWSS